VTDRDAVFEPLLGKGRPLGQALGLLVSRWTVTPLGEEDAGELEAALQHLFRRARLKRELPATANPAELARDFLRALRAGKGRDALATLGEVTSRGTSTGRAARQSGT
jgi:hypothetical protein